MTRSFQDSNDFLILLVCATQLAGCNPLGSSSIEGDFLASASGGGVTPSSGGSCTAGTATASDVLSGATFPDGSGGMTTGTMTNRGTWNMTTAGFPGIGYFAGVAGVPALSDICSTATFGGSAGQANCTTALPTLSIAENALSWGAITTATSKSLTFSIAAAGSNFAKLAFSGTGLSGFKVTSIAGRTVSSTPSAASNVIIGLTSPGQTSTTVNFEPVFTDGAAKTMTVTVTDGNSVSTAISADATFSCPIPGVAGLLAWYKADALALADGAMVASWTDSSASANHATQGTDSLKPLYKTNIMNGQPAILFDGSDDFFTLGTRLTTVRTGFMVIKHQTGTQSYPFILGDTNAGGSISFHGGDANALFAPGWMSATLSSSYSNGTSTATGSIIKSTSTQIVSFTTAADGIVGVLSQDRSFGRTWNGWIAEVILYDNAISGANLSLVECFLAGKYGVTLGHGC